MKTGCAVNFCDYDSLKHYDSGSFNSKYKTDLTGKLEAVKKDSLNDDLASTFLHKQYQTFKTLDELILYRVFGLYGRANGKVEGARSSGGYASTEFAESLIDAKLRLAYAFLAIRHEDISILDFIKYAARYFLLSSRNIGGGYRKKFPLDILIKSR